MQALEYLCPLGHVVMIQQTPQWAALKRIWECKQCQARVRVHLRDDAKRPRNAHR